MKGNRRIGTTAPLALSIIAASFAFASLAAATPAPRTFVASTGNDSNAATNCTAANPCRSFSVAYGVTASGGEIIALDTAGFGLLTISMPISIIGTPQGAEVTVGAGQTGITISAAAGNRIILRNINVNGGSSGGNTGIMLNSGHLYLQNSVLKLLNTGLSINATSGQVTADLNATDIIGNTVGISTVGQGVNINNNSDLGSPFAVARLFGGNVEGNTTAFFENDPGTASGASRVTVMLSNPVTTNTTGNATIITGSGTSCTAACQNYGFYTNGGQSSNQQP